MAHYLKANALIEPLVHRFLAIHPLIAPAPAALMMTSRYVPILESFVRSPKQHAAALSNPKLAGGPFVSLTTDQVPAVAELLRQIRSVPALFEFAAAQKQVNALLDQVTGYSLEPLYAKLPDALRGIIELTYNARHSPKPRYMEGILYQSRYYIQNAQTISVSLLGGDTRPFVMSTPILSAPEKLDLPIPFSNPKLDRLFNMRWHAENSDEVSEELALSGARKDLFKSFLTDDPPVLATRFEGPGARLRFFGHSCVLIESGMSSILVDPVISYEYLSNRHERFTLNDLPARLDYVLITHGHADHVSPELLMQLRGRVGQFVVPKSSGDGFTDPSLRLMLRQLGIKNTVEVEEFDRLELEDGYIWATPFLGEHCDFDIRSKVVYVVEIANKRIALATDSNALEPRIYDVMRSLAGDLDVLLVGTACDGGPMSYSFSGLLPSPVPRDIDQSRRENGATADGVFEMIDRLKPKFVGIYAMGLEPWVRHIFPVHYGPRSRPMTESAKVLEYCNARGVSGFFPTGRSEVNLPP